MPTLQAISTFFIHIYYLAAPCPNLDGYYLGVSLAYLVLVTVFLQFQPKDYQEVHNKVGFLSPTGLLNNT